MKHVRHLCAALMVTSMLLVGTTLVNPSVAHAYASSCTFTKKLQVPVYGWIPLSYFCFGLYGSGSEISGMRATWRAAKLCRWRIDWITYYEDGREHWRSTGPTSSGCDLVTRGRVRGAGSAPMWGRVCARIYSYGKWVGGVCHRIQE